MRFNNLAIFLTLFSFNTLAFDYVKGKIQKVDDKFYITNSNDRFEIKASQVIMDSLPSLYKPSYVTQSNGVPYSFEFKGTIHKDQFKLAQVPTNIAGNLSLRGTLTSSQQEGLYFINGTTAIFGYTKILNGYEFDKLSKDAFKNQEVIVDGDYNKDGIFVIQAITPANLFSATPPVRAPEPVEKILNEDGVENLILKKMIKNKHSQNLDSFRLSFQIKKDDVVKPGDHALLITLSGRQGDSFGSINGHFVAGLAEVKENMDLRSEVSNAYVTNGKDILSGNTSLSNYYSHTVQGQNNYRPTYTLIAYGVDPKKLQGFRDALEKSHIDFRTQKLAITPSFNCTTETIKALKDTGIEGIYSQKDNEALGVLSRMVTVPIWGETGRTLHYALKNDPSRYHPRSAFNSFVKAFLSKKKQKELGIKRLDYVFYKQIPSHRPVGGMALGKVLKTNKFIKLYKKYEVEEETKLSPKELRPILQKELQKIPFKSGIFKK